MILKVGSGREVEIKNVSGKEDDVQIDKAVYVDTGDDITDEDREEIYTMYPEHLFEAWHDKQQSKADAMLDAQRDEEMEEVYIDSSH